MAVVGLEAHGGDADTPFRSWEQVAGTLERGDLIQFRRGNMSSGGYLYSHWAIFEGVFDGEHRVIHFSNGDDEEEDAPSGAFAGVGRWVFGQFREVLKAKVRVDPLEKIANGCACRKNNGWDGREVNGTRLTPFSPDEIIRRARERIGTGGYSPVSNNCEHLAHWCRYGREMSAQVADTSQSISNITLPFGISLLGLAAIAGAFVFSQRVKKNKQEEENERVEER